MATQPIIWPLREKLFNNIFYQQKPKWMGGRTPPLPTVLPWAMGVRPPTLANNRQPYVKSLALGFGKVPLVVHEIKPLPVVNWMITGISRDNTGAALGNCTMSLFKVDTDSFGDETYTFITRCKSDASGNYSFGVNGVFKYQITGTNGAETVWGITLNNLTGTIV